MKHNVKGRTALARRIQELEDERADLIDGLTRASFTDPCDGWERGWNYAIQSVLAGVRHLGGIPTPRRPRVRNDWHNRPPATEPADAVAPAAWGVR